MVGRERLFPIPAAFVGVPSPVATNYDITSDDERFLMARRYQGDAQEEGGAPEPPRLILVQNFFEELKARVPN